MIRGFENISAVLKPRVSNTTTASSHMYLIHRVELPQHMDVEDMEAVALGGCPSTPPTTTY
eukprot:1670667-Pyramimonas_sp.AAC.2